MIKYVIAYHVSSNQDGTVTITDSYDNHITSDNSDKLWEFLYTPYRDKYSRELKFFWNLDESLAPIFKLMNPEKCKALLNTKFQDAKHLYYRRGKNMIIKGNHIINGNTPESNHPYMCCLYGLEPLIKSDVHPSNAHEALEQCQRLLKALENIGITTPMTLNSAIGIYESSMRNIQLTPNIKCIPLEAVDILNYAKHCANRQGWVTNIMAGHFKESFSYDVSSSYGFWLSQVRDFENAEYIPYSKDYSAKHAKEIINGDITGFFKVILTIFKDVKVHPFAYVDNNGKVIYPTGTFETYLTLEEMISIHKYKVGTLTVLDGYYVRFKNYKKPMENIVKRFFNMRSLGEIENDLCKGIIVGYVGKTNAQFEDNKTSTTYNPMIAGWIYAQARLQVFKFIMDNNLQDNIIAISTDGVMTTRKVDDNKISKEKIIGTWRLNEPCPAIVLSPGWIIYKDKKPHSITYDMAIEAINNNPNTNHYNIPTIKRVTLFEAIEILHDISQVGNLTEHSNTIDLAEIEMSQDRIFKYFPKNGKALLSKKTYNSIPIEI